MFKLELPEHVNEARKLDNFTLQPASRLVLVEMPYSYQCY